MQLLAKEWIVFGFTNPNNDPTSGERSIKYLRALIGVIKKHVVSHSVFYLIKLCRKHQNFCKKYFVLMTRHVFLKYKFQTFVTSCFRLRSLNYFFNFSVGTRQVRLVLENFFLINTTKLYKVVTIMIQ